MDEMRRGGGVTVCCRNEKKRVEKSKCGKRCAVLILARLDFRPPAFGGRAILSCNCREEQGAPREGGGEDCLARVRLSRAVLLLFRPARGRRKCKEGFAGLLWRACVCVRECVRACCVCGR